MNKRQPAFAGSWYPDTFEQCEFEIQQFIKESVVISPPLKNYNAGIVPHASWYFSGNIACNVIRLLQQQNNQDSNSKIDLIIIFGMHLHSDSLPYIMTEGVWQTPMGNVNIHKQFAKIIEKQFDFHIETVDNYMQDNTIELQLPFIKYFFKESKIISIGVPPSNIAIDIGKSVVDIAHQLNLNIKILGSTDLTHYGTNYGFSPKGTGQSARDWVQNENDKKAIDAMIKMKPDVILAESLINQNLCCGGAVAATLSAAKKLGSQKGFSVAYSTSYEKHKNDSFVGYSGVLF